MMQINLLQHYIFQHKCNLDSNGGLVCRRFLETFLILEMIFRCKRGHIWTKLNRMCSDFTLEKAYDFSSLFELSR